MPTYDYQCNKCGDKFEAFQSMSDAALTDCGKCGGDVKRLISGGTGIIFKGSGFYVNDYKGSKGGSASAAKDSAPSSSSSSGCSGGGCPHKS